MQIAACRTYHAITSRATILTMPDGKSAFKVYYISIIGRHRPELYEWEGGDLTQDEFERQFRASAHEGVGFVIGTHLPPTGRVPGLISPRSRPRWSEGTAGDRSRSWCPRSCASWR